MLSSTQSRGCITIDTVDDRILESTESFTLQVFQVIIPRGVSEEVRANLVLSPNQTVVDILDNTGSLVIQ